MSILFILLQHLLPQHLLSRMVGMLAESQVFWLKNTLIKSFVSLYRVDLSEAINPDPESYLTFNDFFTRSLQATARPLDTSNDVILFPADGHISAIGSMSNDAIFQAKGRTYSLRALLGATNSNDEWIQALQGGEFATVYLSPRDYHRVHMPVSGTLQEIRYIPGDLFSVNNHTAESVDSLFARNERAVCCFHTRLGPMAIVLVGAMIVAGIETVATGKFIPGCKEIQHLDYRNKPIMLAAGAELGRFYLGSTAIILLPGKSVKWDSGVTHASATRMGARMGKINLLS